MKKQEKNVLFLIILIAATGIMAVTWWIFTPGTQSGIKQITVEVIVSDTDSRRFPFSTEEEYLGKLLLDEGLISGETGAYGLYITVVDGVEADMESQQWWCVTQNGGQEVTTGVDSLPIEDGAVYELSLVTGFSL